MSATSARRQVIKLANKRNLSLGLFGLVLLTHLAVMCAVIPMHAFTLNWEETDDGDKSISPWAQVPPRFEAAQEQREEKAPLVFTDDPLSLTRWCTLTFVGKDGKEAVLDFCGEKLTYSGDLGVDEPARLFFEALMENIAVCKPSTKEKREE